MPLCWVCWYSHRTGSLCGCTGTMVNVSLLHLHACTSCSQMQISAAVWHRCALHWVPSTYIVKSFLSLSSLSAEHWRLIGTQKFLIFSVLLLDVFRKVMSDAATSIWYCVMWWINIKLFDLMVGWLCLKNAFIATRYTCSWDVPQFTTEQFGVWMLVANSIQWSFFSWTTAIPLVLLPPPVPLCYFYGPGENS